MSVRVETLSPVAVEGYRGTFAPHEEPRALGVQLPPGWEGIAFPFAVPLGDLRPDGTPARDGVIPAFDLPRRMYAGEDTTFLSPLAVGDIVTQTTSLGAVTHKSGSQGRLVFVDVEREYSVAGQVAIRSVWHDVFLEAAESKAPTRPPRTSPEAVRDAEWIDECVLDARALFRFSALTFNTHLIHYDRAWAREVEGLPDLLVHGPLTRILLMDAARRHAPGARVRTLSVRMIAPALVDRRMRLAGRDDAGITTITALDDDDVVLATAEIAWG